MARPRDDEIESADSPFARALARAGGRPSKVVEFPGFEGTRAALWCPNEEEHAEAEVEARKRLTGQYKMSALDLSLAQETDLFERERAVELITLVVRDADDPDDAFFESSDEARKLTKAQRRALIALIEDFERERFEAKTPEQAAEIVRLVRQMGKEGSLSTWLTSCEPDTMREIIELMATDLDDRSTPSNSSSD